MATWRHLNRRVVTLGRAGKQLCCQMWLRCVVASSRDASKLSATLQSFLAAKAADWQDSAACKWKKKKSPHSLSTNLHQSSEETRCAAAASVTLSYQGGCRLADSGFKPWSFTQSHWTWPSMVMYRQQIPHWDLIPPQSSRFRFNWPSSRSPPAAARLVACCRFQAVGIFHFISAKAAERADD